MKKVWILEKYETREECEKMIQQYKELLDESKVEIAGDYEKVLNNLNKTLEDNPDGYWFGWEGKCKYSEFCYVAKEAIRRRPDFQYRVVEALIADDAKFWTNYQITKVNDGVYRYLMATK